MDKLLKLPFVKHDIALEKSPEILVEKALFCRWATLKNGIKNHEKTRRRTRFDP